MAGRDVFLGLTPARVGARLAASEGPGSGAFRMNVAVISDTHLPRGARVLPDACVERLRAADLILHGGDLLSVAFLEELRSFGPPVHAVHGNADEQALKELLPRELVVAAGAVQIGMVHNGGPGGRAATSGLRLASPAAQRSSTATRTCPKWCARGRPGSSTPARRPSAGGRRSGR